MKIKVLTFRKLFMAMFVCCLVYFDPVNSIDCFKCISINGDNKACDDPFHNNYTLDIYESPCMGGMKHRNGLFPATSCIKIAGYFVQNKVPMVVRGCALDSGTLTADTEIVRMSHCGELKYDNKDVKGCLQTCNNADGCNHSPSIINQSFYLTTIVAFISIAFIVII